MTAKEFLRQYLNAEQAINAKLNQTIKLRELAEKTTQELTPDRIMSGSHPDKVAAIVSKIVDMETEIDADITRLREIKCQVEDVIAAVSDEKQQVILTLRYINGYRWEEIAVCMHLDYRWVLRLHGKALEKIKLTIESHY